MSCCPSHILVWSLDSGFWNLRRSLVGTASDLANPTNRRIPATLRAGKSAVKTLNAIFRQIYKGNHEVLAARKSASHVQREPKSTAPPVTPPPPAP